MPELLIFNGYEPRQLLIQNTDPMKGFIPGLQSAYQQSASDILQAHFGNNVAYMGSGAFTSPNYPGKTIVTGTKLTELIKEKDFLIHNGELVKGIANGTLQANAVAVDKDGNAEAINIDAPPPPPKKPSWLMRTINKAVQVGTRWSVAGFSLGLSEIEVGNQHKRLGVVTRQEATASALGTAGMFVTGTSSPTENLAFSYAGKAAAVIASAGWGASVAAAEGTSTAAIAGGVAVKVGAAGYSSWQKWEKRKDLPSAKR